MRTAILIVTLVNAAACVSPAPTTATTPPPPAQVAPAPDPAPAPVAAPAPAPAPAPATATAPEADLPPPEDPVRDLAAAMDAGIRKLDDTTYEIDRALVEQVLANPVAGARGTRVVPSVKDGQPNGFKLYAIRPASLYARIGFQNGDTLHAVNGIALDSMEKALEAFTRARDASSLSVSITRRGKPITLTYTIK